MDVGTDFAFASSSFSLFASRAALIKPSNSDPYLRCNKRRSRITYAQCLSIYFACTLHCYIRFKKRILCCSMASELIFSSGIMASLSSCSRNLFRNTLTSTGSVESTFALYSEIHSLCLLMRVFLSPLSGNPSSYPPMHLT